ncbi:hypothetical protein VKT23_002562 [Stygiomarasmius scandens]|uniref:SH3 domain-containing protein n=1 Tax=Marasmiellus scandens TaxID=2682957 RepID=A0ABR1K8E6_9AGAR
MVFTNLPHHEKDAFFSLLDEYFQSRPELASALQNAGSSTDTDNGTQNVDVGHVAGRVAAAASAFNRSQSDLTPPKHAPAKHADTSAPKGLVTVQRLGDVDTSGTKRNIFMSGLTAKKQPPRTGPPVIPSAFGAKKSSFAPPPVHRKPSEPEPEPEPEPEHEEEEEVAQGEWAEALYDYEPSDPNDLGIRAKQNIWVTEKTSDDWWTGQVDGTGKSGLFPASYVKLL